MKIWSTWSGLLHFRCTHEWDILNLIRASLSLMFLPQILYGKTILISGLYPITKRPPLNGPQISILDWDFKLNLFYTATHHKPRWWIASTIDHFRLQDLLCWTPNRALTEGLLDTPAANANVLTGSDLQ